MSFTFLDVENWKQSFILTVTLRNQFITGKLHNKKLLQIRLVYSILLYVNELVLRGNKVSPDSLLYGAWKPGGKTPTNRRTRSQSPQSARRNILSQDMDESIVQWVKGNSWWRILFYYFWYFNTCMMNGL